MNKNRKTGSGKINREGYTAGLYEALSAQAQAISVLHRQFRQQKQRIQLLLDRVERLEKQVILLQCRAKDPTKVYLYHDDPVPF